MSQHYLKYHLKSLICTNYIALNEDESNGNHGKDIDTDVINGNSTGRRCNSNTNSNSMSFIRITENPLN